jgi:hypothetical protein
MSIEFSVKVSYNFKIICDRLFKFVEKSTLCRAPSHIPQAAMPHNCTLLKVDSNEKLGGREGDSKLGLWRWKVI